MKSLPKLTRDGRFTIESVTRHSGPEGSFRVSLRLSNRERRHVVVNAEALFDFNTFRIAALVQANVYLRHDAETRTPERQQHWLDEIDEAIPLSDDE